jgi:RimJ/RimL family protein N-acetyltransferase
MVAVMEVETPRLKLVPYSPTHLLALIESTQQFAQAFGVPAAEGLRGFFVSGEIPPAWLDQLRQAASADVWQHGFAVVHRGDRLVIGNVGFKGPPDDTGAVEIAYAIVSAYQRQGYATEAAEAATCFALKQDRVRRVRAHTLPGPNASTHVLAKCRFEHIGQLVDPDDGPVWRFERA